MNWFWLLSTLWFIWLIFIIVSSIAMIAVLLQEIIENGKLKNSGCYIWRYEDGR